MHKKRPTCVCVATNKPSASDPMATEALTPLYFIVGAIKLWSIKYNDPYVSFVAIIMWMTCSETNSLASLCTSLDKFIQQDQGYVLSLRNNHQHLITDNFIIYITNKLLISISSSTCWKW
jgi:hypothetical protein